MIQTYSNLNESVTLPITISLAGLVTADVIDSIKYNKDDKKYAEYKQIANKYYELTKPKINIMKSVNVSEGINILTIDKVEKLMIKHDVDIEHTKCNLLKIYKKDKSKYFKKENLLATLLICTEKDPLNMYYYVTKKY